ncbi:uracil phosphoribosyltransferase [Taibaiella lutea]|uniref:Uracil phosphoribosyltransferase n=1 Tax=Taibaiella lutea TaxID=2608001 RepID=A0A5M6CDL0_9BACT|nr:uracil phosphoribosyltransferase [Taibaiella lutea]KAA5533264.1 uracil phosphoribosyltransferase [Taibaiella lutea]
MVYNLSDQQSLITQWVSEIRDIDIQKDRLRFRRNMERIAEVAAYEISKQLPFITRNVITPLGESETLVIEEQPVLATILRAGVPMHNGLLNFFDKADSAFIAAYRKHHRDGSFEIEQHYITCPPLKGRPLIIADPMLATGASLILALETLLHYGMPAQIHIVSAIACSEGIENVERKFPEASIWAATIDEELTARGYIVPGLGDAGDLAFGSKEQF